MNHEKLRVANEKLQNPIEIDGAAAKKLLRAQQADFY